MFRTTIGPLPSGTQTRTNGPGYLAKGADHVPVHSVSLQAAERPQVIETRSNVSAILLAGPAR